MLGKHLETMRQFSDNQKKNLNLLHAALQPSRVRPHCCGRLWQCGPRQLPHPSRSQSAIGALETPQRAMAATVTSCAPTQRSGQSLLFVQIQLMCGAAIINLLSVNASSDDPNQLNVF